jgi:hypothetical protein
VQFNPASLSIDAHGGGRVPVSNYSMEGTKNKGTITYGPREVSINISFTLIVDASTNLTRGTEDTVRPFVDGFLAAIRDPGHRTMIFQWGKLRYVGLMNSVNCSYTMFNSNGEPVRAELQVNMLSESQANERYNYETEKEGQTKSDGDYLGYWSKRYDAIADGNTSVSGRTWNSFSSTAIGNMCKAYVLLRKHAVQNRDAAASSFLPVKVQYNPKAISFSGTQSMNRRSGVGGEEQFQQVNAPVETIMQVQLDFDDTDIRDAFMYGVQDISEVFVGAMVRPSTRWVAFVWNRMIFWGELNNVTVRYTMFNPAGSPIRSQVTLCIRQDRSLEDASRYATEKEWDKAFDKMFCTKTGAVNEYI